MYLKEVGYAAVHWIDLVQNKNQWWNLVVTVMNLRIPGEKREFLDPPERN
jgi:hypothetical protein